MSFCDMFTQLNYSNSTYFNMFNFNYSGENIFTNPFNTDSFNFMDNTFMKSGCENIFGNTSSINNRNFTSPILLFPSCSIFNMQMPDMNFSFSFNPFTTTTTTTTKSSQSFKMTQTTQNVTMDTKGTKQFPAKAIGAYDSGYWSSHGYDSSKGNALAKDAYSLRDWSKRMPENLRGQCVGKTRETINRIYGTNFTNAGAAKNFGTTILSAPQLKGKFRKATESEIAQHGIPNGAVVLWEAGSPGFTKHKAALYGHGGIYYNGSVYSNYAETRHIPTYKEVWVPVKA